MAKLAPFVLLLGCFCVVLLIFSTATEKTGSYLDLTIIHTNDIHSRVDQINSAATDCTPSQYVKQQCYGGTARHKTVIDGLRRKSKFSLLLDGGDEFQGSMFYTYYKGNVTSQVMNLLGYNLTAIGNHEFDDGPEVLAAHYKRLNMPVVCANIDTTRNPNLGQYIKPYHIFKEYKLAVIGYITETTGSISNSGDTLSFSDPIPAVQKYVDELHAKGIKRILTLSHNGYNEDKKLAAQTYGVAVHVGGHSHTLLSNRTRNAQIAQGPYPTTVKNAKGEDTLIVQAFWSGTYIGQLDVVLDEHGKVVQYSGEPIHIDQSIPQDAQVNRLVADWRKPFDRYSKRVIGQAASAFDQTKCQTGECQMGNLIADSILRSRVSNPNVVAAIIHAGTIRAGLMSGNITQGEILTILPFNNSLIDIVLSGKNISDILESVIGRKNVISGNPVTSFIQVSGLQFVYDSSKEIGKRLVEATIWDPIRKTFARIQPNKLYTLVTLEFLAKAGDGIIAYPIDGTVLPEQDYVVLQRYIETKHIITPYLDGRIKDLAASVDSHIVSIDEPLHYRYVRPKEVSYAQFRIENSKEETRTRHRQHWWKSKKIMASFL